MFYINQLGTPSFLIGLVKTESGSTLRSVETGIGRSTLVVAVISVDDDDDDDDELFLWYG